MVDDTDNSIFGGQTLGRLGKVFAKPAGWSGQTLGSLGKPPRPPAGPPGLTLATLGQPFGVPAGSDSLLFDSATLGNLGQRFTKPAEPSSGVTLGTLGQRYVKPSQSSSGMTLGTLGQEYARLAYDPSGTPVFGAFDGARPGASFAGLHRKRPQQADGPQYPASFEMSAADPMGNLTGGMVDVAPPVSMPYGDQMKHVGQFYGQLGRTAADSGSFGLTDKAIAGVRALTGSAPSYDEALQEERANTQIAERNPFASVAKIGGAFLTGSGLAKSGLTLASGAEDASLLVKSLLSGGDGALYGAAKGMGHTDGSFRDYVKNGLDEAAKGALVRAALPWLGAAARSAYRWVSPFTRRSIGDVSGGKR